MTNHTFNTPLRYFLLLALIAAAGSTGLAADAAAQQASSRYFPEANAWERRAPAEVGMNAEVLSRAAEFASDPARADFEFDLYENMIRWTTNEPFNAMIGPLKTRGPATGIVIRNGYIVAEWGEPRRVDMTFSVTKSFVSTTVGLAYDRGMIRDLHDFTWEYMAPVIPALPQGAMRGGYESASDMRPLELFESEHNRRITWDHLLRQTSNWEGTLWGKPDWADRPTGDPLEWGRQTPPAPGTAYKYNDVRVNLLALASMNIWRRPLPEVLKERVMDPIGASDTWRWHGYNNSWVVMDGQVMQSVSGGGHWGGGMWVSALDQARFGYLTMNKGNWNGQQILSEEWIRLATTPSEHGGGGFMNYSLNTDRRSVPAAPETAFWHSGGGINRIYVDSENDLVVVVRWLAGEHFREFMELVLSSIDD